MGVECRGLRSDQARFCVFYSTFGFASPSPSYSPSRSDPGWRSGSFPGRMIDRPTFNRYRQFRNPLPPRSRRQKPDRVPHSGLRPLRRASLRNRGPIRSRDIHPVVQNRPERLWPACWVRLIVRQRHHRIPWSSNRGRRNRLCFGHILQFRRGSRSHCPFQPGA
jgi:hypothetical protein